MVFWFHMFFIGMKFPLKKCAISEATSKLLHTIQLEFSRFEYEYKKILTERQSGESWRQDQVGSLLLLTKPFRLGEVERLFLNRRIGERCISSAEVFVSPLGTGGVVPTRVVQLLRDGAFWWNYRNNKSKTSRLNIFRRLHLITY